MDFYLSRKRDVNAAKAFFRKAVLEQRTPTKITLDAYAASHRAVADLKETGGLPKRVQVRSCKYLNNIIEIVLTQMTKPDLFAVRMEGGKTSCLFGRAHSNRC